MIVYADCAADAPVLGRANAVMSAYSFANPNSVHLFGRKSRESLENARAVIAECIGAEPGEIYFTPSATAACRSAVSLLEIPHCSPHEHEAVKSACRWQIIGSGIDPEAHAHILASNETGEIFIDEVMQLVEQGKKVFTDATAAMGHLAIDVKELGVAALAAGAHKFGGPPGIGFLYVKDGVAERGVTERDFSYPGTPPVGLACAMAEALKYRTENMEMTRTTLAERVALGRALEKIPGVHLNVREKPRLPHILSVRFDGIDARELLTLLDVNGVFASAGSACHAEDDKPSAALLAAGLTEEQAKSTVRFSFSEETTGSEYDTVADVVKECVERLRRLNPVK